MDTKLNPTAAVSEPDVTTYKICGCGCHWIAEIEGLYYAFGVREDEYGRDVVFCPDGRGGEWVHNYWTARAIQYVTNGVSRQRAVARLRRMCGEAR